MNGLRTGVAVLLVTILGLGYFASQSAALNGDPAAYARAVDVPSVKLLALVALLVVVGLAFLPVKAGEPPE